MVPTKVRTWLMSCFLFCIGLGLAACANNAQQLLNDYHSTITSETQQELRDQLRDQDPDDVLDAIRNLSFPPSQSGLIEHKLLHSDGYERSYWVNIPEGYDPAHAHPVIINLHGSTIVPASKGRGAAEKGWPASLLNETEAEDVIVIGPASDAGNTTVEAWWWRLGGVDLIHEVLRDVKTKYNINDNRVFVAGMSGGGAGCYTLAFRAPDPFTAYLPFCADLLVPTNYGLHTWFENLKGQHIRQVHGEDDAHYKVEKIHAGVDAANAHGALIDLRTYPGEGHKRKFVLQHEFPLFLQDMVTKLERNLVPPTIDWVTDTPKTGRRAWVSIDEIGEVPSDTEMDISGPMLLLNKLATRPRLGFIPYNKGDEETPGPLFIFVVAVDSVASRMGLQPEDELIAVNNHPITTEDELRAQLELLEWNEQVTIQVRREGEALTLKATPKEGQLYQFDASHPQARIQAKLESKGQIHLTTHKVKTFSIWVAPQMLDTEGKLTVWGNGKLLYSGTPQADAGLILSEFERTKDRRLPFTSRLVFHLD